MNSVYHWREVDEVEDMSSVISSLADDVEFIAK
jgi:hypothetical protein